MTYPTVRIQPGRDKRYRAGSPWLFSNELDMDADAKALPAGSLTRVMDGNGKTLGVAHFNPHSLIAGRMLTRNKDATIDKAFIAHRLERARALRDRLYDQPDYRLIHAEGDGLPGLVIDRYGDTVAIQLNTAGMQAMQDVVIDAIESVLEPGCILLRNDAPVRQLEGLKQFVETVKGDLPERLEVRENGLTFMASLGSGQKTGWYFDQRDNRAAIGRFAKDAEVLDLYTYGGGFALAAIAAGARSAIAVDRSETALELAQASANHQGVSDRFETQQADSFAAIGALMDDKRRFDLVIADPPPFVRSKKDLATGLRGYRKLARGSSALVKDGGFLTIACCSHNVTPELFHNEVWAGIKAAGRGGRLLDQRGAACDHPVHPGLPETAYLKCLTFMLD